MFGFFIGEKMSRLIDLTEKKFNMLTVIERIKKGEVGGTLWLCLCDCGKEVVVNGRDLKNGGTKSCGCYKKNLISRVNISHGKSTHKLYFTYKNMIARCHNPRATQFNDYGGRGISVCDEWRNNICSFIDWCNLNGWDKGLQIDRKDNDGNYSPSNCRFVTSRDNSLNTRIQSNNKSGYVGVCFDKSSGKYTSSLTIKGKKECFGRHDSIRSAVEARNEYIVKNDLQLEYDLQKYKKGEVIWS